MLRNLREVEVGSLVEVEQEGHNSNPLYGVVRWTGEMASVASAGARLACQTSGLTGLNFFQVVIFDNLQVSGMTLFQALQMEFVLKQN